LGAEHYALLVRYHKINKKSRKMWAVPEAALRAAVQEGGPARRVGEKASPQNQTLREPSEQENSRGLEVWREARVFMSWLKP
jgi:hypothetical protein